MKRFSILFHILCFLVLSNSIFCQDYIWRGGNGAWSNPQKWSPTGVPQLGDDVFIAKGTVHVVNNTAGAKSIEIHSTGGLVVHQNSILSVVENVDNPGILNYGIVETYGSIQSYGHFGSLTTAIGFKNYGKWYIYEQGSYASTICSGYAIFNMEKAIFKNEGNITIINNGSGIWNEGTIVNYKTIFLNDMYTSHGISNYNQFSNEKGSSIRIEGYTENGILSDKLTGSTQLPSFKNKGKISVTKSLVWGIFASDGNFINYAGGSISLFQTEYGGLFIDGFTTFDNQGLLSCQLNKFDGIRGFGHLKNSGFIKSSYNDEIGINFFAIYLQAAGSITNSGEIELSNNHDFDISLQVDLHNTDEGYIYSENALTGYTIINDGIFSTWYNGTSTITFENNGVVEDVNNSLPNIQNNQIVIRPLNGPLTSGVTSFNVLDKASSSNTTISFGWFDQLNNGNVGALYFFWTNSIFVSNFGATAPTMWMDATIQSSGQKRRLRVNILNSASPLTQNEDISSFSSNDLTKKTEFNIYPNPVVNSLNIDATKWSDEPYRFKLFDVSGKEVFGKRFTEGESIDLPLAVSDGLYFGVIYNETEIISRKRIIVSRGNLNRSSY